MLISSSGVDGLNVFILDHSTLILAMMRESLSAHGYEVHGVASLDEFEQKSASKKADLVLIELELPEIFGDDVATVLRSVRAWTVPILLFSSIAPEQLARRALEARADGWISKRDGLHAVVTEVRRMLEARAE